MQGDRRVGGCQKSPPEPAGGRRWGTELAGPGLLATIEWGEQGEEGDVSGPRDGISVTVRDRDFWKRADLAAALLGGPSSWS